MTNDLTPRSEGEPPERSEEDETDDDPQPLDLSEFLTDEDQEILANAAARKGFTLAVRKFYQGPTAPPDVLREYEALVPGSAKLYLEMIPAESKHRRIIEAREVRNDLIVQLVRPLYGLVYAGMVFWLGHEFLKDGHPGAAATLVGAVAVGGIAAFVVGRVVGPSAQRQTDEDD